MYGCCKSIIAHMAVVVSRYDPKHETNKTVCFMGRGDSFGELAIINRTTRDCTVITKETSQFLVLRDEVSDT